MKLTNIDSNKLGVPDKDYDACATMPTSHFVPIVKNLSTLGDCVRIEFSKEGVRFVSNGEGPKDACC